MKTYAFIDSKGLVYGLVNSKKELAEKEGLEFLEVTGRVNVMGFYYDSEKEKFYRKKDPSKALEETVLEEVPLAEKFIKKTIMREYLQQKQKEKQQARQANISKLRAEGRVE